MRRLHRYLPTTLVLSGIAVSLVAGCDLFKPKETDAGADATVVVTAPATDPGAPTTPVATTAAPLTPPAPGPAVHPTTKTDGGVATTDAGPKADGAAPAPIPPFPAFDAGGLQNFDAGGLFKVPDGGFKPPWQK